MKHKVLRIILLCFLATSASVKIQAGSPSSASPGEPAHEMGKSFMEAEDFEKAVEALEISVAQDPNLTQAWYRLAISYGKLGRIEDSDRALSIARAAKKQAAEESSSKTVETVESTKRTEIHIPITTRDTELNSKSTESDFDHNSFAKKLFGNRNSLEGLYAIEAGGKPDIKVTNDDGKYYVSFLDGSSWSRPEGLHDATESELKELFDEQEVKGVRSAVAADNEGVFALAKVDKGVYWGAENDSGYLMFMMFQGGNIYKVNSETSDIDQSKGNISSTISREDALRVLRANERRMALHSEVPIGKGINIDMLISTLMRQAPVEGRMMNGLYGALQRLRHLNFNTITRPMFDSSLTTTDISVTPLGLKHGVIVNQRYFSGSHTYRFRMADRTAFMVTGIREYGLNKCAVNFKYNRSNFSEIFKEAASVDSNAAFSGSAVFSLYDDGWRMESFDCKD
jgi:hypothetical protein